MSIFKLIEAKFKLDKVTILLGVLICLVFINQKTEAAIMVGNHDIIDVIQDLKVGDKVPWDKYPELIPFDAKGKQELLDQRKRYTYYFGEYPQKSPVCVVTDAETGNIVSLFLTNVDHQIVGDATRTLINILTKSYGSPQNKKWEPGSPVYSYTFQDGDIYYALSIAKDNPNRFTDITLFSRKAREGR